MYLSTVQFDSHLRNYVKKENQMEFRVLKHLITKIKNSADGLSRRMEGTEENRRIRKQNNINHSV